MDTVHSDLFGKIKRPKDFNELIVEVSSSHPNNSNRVWMWRGQSNINWPLHSTAARRILRSDKNLSEHSLKYYETILLKQATHKGYRYSNGRELTDFELLARLRHHGAATRLIDFSRNALVALWFASFSNFKKDGLLFGFHSSYLGGYEGIVEERDYEQISLNLQEIDHAVTWEPTNVSGRISAQHSQFLYSSISKSKKGSLYFPKEEEAYQLIAISSGLKKEIISILKQVYDLTYQTLFPDIAGFGHANNPLASIDDMHRW